MVNFQLEPQNNGTKECILKANFDRIMEAKRDRTVGWKALN